MFKWLEVKMGTSDRKVLSAGAFMLFLTGTLVVLGSTALFLLVTQLINIAMGL